MCNTQVRVPSFCSQVVISCPLESVLEAGSCLHCHFSRGDCSQKEGMLIVELNMDLSLNKVLGGVTGGCRNCCCRLVLDVCLEQRQLCVLFREKMELKDPLSMAVLTHTCLYINV